MRKGSAEAVVRKNLSLPKTYADRLEAIKARRASTSDSEVVRQMIGLMEVLTQEDESEIIVRNRKTGKETVIVLP